MKIAFLTSEFPHPKTGTSGGIGTSIMNLSKGLVSLGHEVTILIYGQDEDEFFSEGQLHFYRIMNVQMKGLSWYFTRKKIQKLINTLYSDKKIDIVEAPDWTGITSFINTKCPIVVKLHGSDTYFCHLDKRPVKWFNKWHERLALKKADGLVSVSRYTAQLTNSIFALNRKFTVIPNGIDTAKFKAGNESQPNQSILYFGTLIRKKGALELPHIFNAVFKTNKNARLILVGRDANDIISGSLSTWEMMKPLFAEEVLTNVRYVGSVDHTEIRNLINNAAVCVFPSFAEALPVSWIEAMAMGKAVVASNIGWAPEIIDDGTDGFLVNPESHAEYASKILELLADEDKRKNFGVQAVKKVTERFDIECVSKSNVAFYSEILSRKK